MEVLEVDFPEDELSCEPDLIHREHMKRPVDSTHYRMTSSASSCWLTELIE